MAVEFEQSCGRVLIATLGHVDHGKSTLIKALTGIDPDRLPEEKVLEGTTDLGFAYFKANNGKFYGFIDVPGHRDYLKNLLTGILNAQFYILVVDAQEGVMPQTIEHIELVKCLGLKHGLVVISKIDLVSEQKVKEVEGEVKLLYMDNKLDILPIVCVSFSKNIGIEELKGKLTECLERTPSYIKEGVFVLAVMRSFTLAGKGTIVTGPVIKGTVKKGETLWCRKKSVVREISIFKNFTDTAFTGVTAALNLPGLEVENTRRGEIIVGEKCPEFMDSWESLVLLKHSKKIKKYIQKKSTGCILFILTYNQTAKINFIRNFDDFSICKVQLAKSCDMFSCLPFICYSKDLKNLLGAGEILYTHIDEDELKWLKFVNKKVINKFIKDFNYDLYKTNPLFYLISNLCGEKGVIALPELESLMNLSKYDIFIEDNPNFMVYNDQVVINIPAMFSYMKNILQIFHEKNPCLYGLRIKDLAEDLLLPKDLVKNIVRLMMEQNKLSEYNGFYFLPDFKVQQDKSIIEEIGKLRELFAQNTFLTYSKGEINEIFKQEKKFELAFEKLKADGDIIHIGENRWMSKQGLEKIKEILRNNKNKFSGGFSPKDLKPFLGDLSRKHLIPILEYLDKTGITKWSGNVRYLI